MNFVFSKNNFINDILILVFQVYIKRGTFHFILKNKSICILRNKNIQVTMREGGIDSINATLVCSHFLSWNSTLVHIHAILPSILWITPMFVFKTHTAGLTPFNLLQ